VGVEVDQPRNHQLAAHIDHLLRLGLLGQAGFDAGDLAALYCEVGDLVSPLAGVTHAAALEDEVEAFFRHETPRAGGECLSLRQVNLISQV
jgi:hypothetical protein